MAALCNRVAFTDMVEKALAAGSGLASVQAEIKSKREMLIIAGRDTLPNATHQQLNFLQTLVKEQLDVTADLMAAADSKAAWKDEFRFYVQPDGTIRCKCSDYDVLVGHHFPANAMLVVTPLTAPGAAFLHGSHDPEKMCCLSWSCRYRKDRDHQGYSADAWD